jgi:Regulator of chromosome condensation (RCC1) repeat
VLHTPNYPYSLASGYGKRPGSIERHQDSLIVGFGCLAIEIVYDKQIPVIGRRPSRQNAEDLMRNGLVGLVIALVFALMMATAGCSNSSSGGGTGGSSSSRGQADAGTGGSSGSGGQADAGTGGSSSSGGSTSQGDATSGGSSGNGTGGSGGGTGGAGGTAKLDGGGTGGGTGGAMNYDGGGSGGAKPEAGLGDVATGGNSNSGGHADAGTPDVSTGATSTDGSVRPAVDSGSTLHVLGVAVGSDGLCIILPDHTVECSGPNVYGTPGKGTLTPVAGLTAVSTLAFEGGDTVCALLTDKTVTCWGDNTYGQLGIGNITGPAPCYLYSESVCALTPTPVPSLSGVTAIVEGGAHACALITGGAVSCWGENNYGQLGNGTTTGPDITGPKSPVPGQPCNSTPTAVPGLSGVTAIAAGVYQTCAVLADKTVSCWGSTTTATVPVAVVGVENAVAVAAGYEYACALLTDGTVSCWGAMGSSSANDSGPPGTAFSVTGLTDVTAISAAVTLNTTMCALRGDGTVWCWSVHSGFLVGPPPPSGATSPVQVSGLVGVATAISVGASGACAVLSDATLWCWGNVGLGSNSAGATIVGP